MLLNKDSDSNILSFMKLANLLQKHSEAIAQSALSQNLGDSFLLTHNTIYKQIRLKALDLGFRYSTEVSEDYTAFPMGQLENILQEKIIPYVNNVTPLQKLNKKTASSLEWNHVVDNLKPNYLFHESCHAVSRSFVPKIKSNKFKSQLTTTLIEESFANTCEFFAISEAHDQVHRIFLEVNSYFTIFEDRSLLKKIIEQNGKASVFKFMLLCYLHSNFLNEKLEDKDFKRIIELAHLESQAEIKILKSLAKNAFALNPRFRYTTTEMYMRLNGVTQSVTEVVDFDYLQLIKDDKNLSGLVAELSLFIDK